jgi:hypothetical protein
LDLHELASIALAYARCKCGWFHRAENLKGETDEDLAIETGYAFERHRAESTTSDR